MVFDWNNEKNQSLKKHRTMSYEHIVVAIEEGHLLDVLEHPNKDKYPGQILLIVEIDQYVYVVPCVMEKDVCYMKTLFPSRKYTNKYLPETRRTE